MEVLVGRRYWKLIEYIDNLYLIQYLLWIGQKDLLSVKDGIEKWIIINFNEEVEFLC